MGGFWIPLFLHACFPHNHGSNNNSSNGTCDATTNANGTSNESPVEDGATTTTTNTNKVVAVHSNSNNNNNDPTESQASSSAELSKSDDEAAFVALCGGLVRLKNLPLFVSYNLGEIFHNFTDGIFVGVAFLSCGRDIQISIVLATILHELPNQLAGYLVMVNQCGMNPFVALFVNFVFGLSILFGALLILVVNFSQVAVGCLLAMGGGTFLHVAISELLGNAEKFKTERVHTFYMFFAFLVGAIPIGLILLNHQHC